MDEGITIRLPKARALECSGIRNKEAGQSELWESGKGHWENAQ